MKRQEIKTKQIFNAQLTHTTTYFIDKILPVIAIYFLNKIPQ